MSHQSNLPPKASGPSAAVTSADTVSTSFSASAPISSLQQMVQSSSLSRFPDKSGAQHEKPGPPKLITASSSAGVKYSSAGLVPPLVSISGASVVSKPCEPAHAPHHQARTSSSF